MHKSFGIMQTKNIFLIGILGVAVACSDVKPLKRPGLQQALSGSLIKDGDGQSTTGPDTERKTDSLAAFKKGVYPLLVEWCSRCHAAINGPLFAQDDARSALENLTKSAKVDLRQPDKSRIYLRLAEDSHNCPTPRCDESAQKLLEAIKQWASDIKADQDLDDTTKTANLGLVGGAPASEEISLPAEAIRLEAESATTVTPPMRVSSISGTSGGLVLTTPEGSGNRLDAAAAARPGVGAATLSFEVTKAANYQVIGRVQGPSATKSSLYIRIDGKDLNVWDVPETGDKFEYAVMAAKQGGPATAALKLDPGTHRLEIIQREEMTAIDTIVLVPDSVIDPTSITKFVRTVRSLKFDLEPFTGIAGSKISVDVSQNASDKSYILKNLRLIVPTGSIRIKGVRPIINGQISPVNSTFVVVDQTVTAPGATLSKASLIALKDKGEGADQFGFSFEVLQGKP